MRFSQRCQGDLGTTRQKIAGASYGGQFPSLIYTVHNASVSATYDLDVFGGNRRYVEELEAQKEYQRFQVEAAYISLTANVVTTAVQEASLRGQIDATQKIINEETKQRDLLQRQLDLGAVAKTALLAEEALLAQTKATLPPLEKQLAETRHELSALAGQLPSDAQAEFTLDSMTLPTTLPVTVPSQLVEQRPDVPGRRSQFACRQRRYRRRYCQPPAAIRAKRGYRQCRQCFEQDVYTRHGFLERRLQHQPNDF